jgi:hypothetical protein
MWRRIRKLPNPVQLVITAGAVAGAITAILVLVDRFKHHTPPAIQAQFRHISVDEPISLQDFALHARVAMLPDTQRSDGLVLRVVNLPSATTAQSAGTTTAPTPESPQTTSTPPSATTTTPSPTGTTTTPLGTTGGPSVLGRTAASRVQKELPPAEIPDSWHYIRTSDGQVVLQVPRREKTESLSFVDTAKAGPNAAVVAAGDLARVFEHSRLVRVSGTGTPVTVGADVNFDITLVGLQGRTVEVRWSLYRANGHTPVPRDWLINRRVLRASSEAATDTESGEFWVPLPRHSGRYFIRLSAYDSNGRRAYMDSKPFS